MFFLCANHVLECFDHVKVENEHKVGLWSVVTFTNFELSRLLFLEVKEHAIIYSHTIYNSK